MLVTDGILLFDDLLEYEYDKLSLRERTIFLRSSFVATMVISLVAILDFLFSFVFGIWEVGGMIFFVILFVLLSVQIGHIVSGILRKYCIIAFVLDKKSEWKSGRGRYLVVAKSLYSDNSILIPVKRGVYRACKEGEIFRLPIKESWMEENYLNGRKMRVSLINDLKREIELKGHDKVSESSLEEFYQKSYFRLLIEGSCCYVFILLFFLVSTFLTEERLLAAITLFVICVPIFILPRPWRYRVDLPNIDTVEGMSVYYKGEKMELDGRIEEGKFVWNRYTKRYMGIKYVKDQKQLGGVEASRLSTYLEVFLRKRKLFKHNGGIWSD